MTAVEHTSSAVYHKVIGCQILGVVSTTHDVYLQTLAKPLAEYRREFHTSYILVLWRVGARLGNYYQTFAGEQLHQMVITAGVGFPIKMWGTSSINLGFEYGRTSSPATTTLNGMKVGLVKQNYYKITLGFSIFSIDTSDYWFVRQKYD